VRLNSDQQAATTWSDADRQMAIERLELEIHHMTPAKCNIFDKLLQCHELQLLQEVGTKATGPGSEFTRDHALMKTAAEDKTYGAANMTTNMRLRFQTAYQMLGQKP